MRLVMKKRLRPILILTLGRNRLTGINRRRQTAHTPLIAIDRIAVIVLALPKPKRDPARRRRARVPGPIVGAQIVQTARHAGGPGGERSEGVGRVAAFVRACAGGVVACNVRWGVPVDAVRVFCVRCYYAAEGGEGEAAIGTAAAAADVNAAAAAGGGDAEGG